MLPSTSSSQALVVGVAQYHHIKSLSPNRDATGVYDVLTSADYCAYPAQHVELLRDDQATRERILAGLRRLCERSTPTSRTFVYFSGHGGQSAAGSYLIPVDAHKEDLPSTAISAKQLAELLAGCAGEVTVVLDCCYAGGMAPPLVADGLPSPSLQPFGESLRHSLQATNRVVIAGSRAHDFSYTDREEPYGILTGHMLDALCGKASVDGGDVTVPQLFDYVQKQAVLSSGRLQHPVLLANVERFYPLTRYPALRPPSPIFEQDVYLCYELEDAQQRTWVESTLLRELQGAGLSVWCDELGDVVLRDDVIVKSKYVVVLVTQSLLRNRAERFKATASLLQAVHEDAPRFLCIRRDQAQLPPTMRMFAGLDMSDANRMQHADSIQRLIARLKKDPYRPRTSSAS